MDEDQYNQTFQNNDDEELIKLKAEREKKEHLYRSAVQHLEQIKNIEKSYNMDKGKKTFKQKHRQEMVLQSGKSTSQPKIKGSNQLMMDHRINTEASHINMETRSKESYIEQPVLVIKKKNLVLKNTTTFS